ncbi:MAG: CDP-alcohol phosphatidyltransferase family protein [Angelakisella sp.]
MFLRQLPNLLSLVRLLLIPVIFNNYLNARSPLDFLLCGVLLVISGITDIADGVIARKFNLISNVGKVLDPVADKLTQFAVALVLCMRHSWIWPLLALLVVKDMTMAVLGIYLYRRYRYIGSAKWYGKVATIVFYVVIIAVVALPDMLVAEHLTLPIYIIIGAMLFSGIMYAVSASFFVLRNRTPAPLPEGTASEIDENADTATENSEFEEKSSDNNA